MGGPLWYKSFSRGACWDTAPTSIVNTRGRSEGLCKVCSCLVTPLSPCHSSPSVTWTKLRRSDSTQQSFPTVLTLRALFELLPFPSVQVMEVEGHWTVEDLRFVLFRGGSSEASLALTLGYPHHSLPSAKITCAPTTPGYTWHFKTLTRGLARWLSMPPMSSWVSRHEPCTQVKARSCVSTSCTNPSDVYFYFPHRHFCLFVCWDKVSLLSLVKVLHWPATYHAIKLAWIHRLLAYC